MSINRHKLLILTVLLSASRRSLEENTAWSAIEAVHNEQNVAAAEGRDKDERLDDYIHKLALIYTHHTGAMPGYSNADSGTRFERFVIAIPAPAGIYISRHTVKKATRRLKDKAKR